MVDSNRVEGAFDKAKGAVKEGVGKMTGDEKMQAEGTADKAKGTAKSTVGGAKDAVARRSRQGLIAPQATDQAGASARRRPFPFVRPVALRSELGQGERAMR